MTIKPNPIASSSTVWRESRPVSASDGVLLPPPPVDADGAAAMWNDALSVRSPLRAPVRTTLRVPVADEAR